MSWYEPIALARKLRDIQISLNITLNGIDEAKGFIELWRTTPTSNMYFRPEALGEWTRRLAWFESRLPIIRAELAATEAALATATTPWYVRAGRAIGSAARAGGRVMVRGGRMIVSGGRVIVGAAVRGLPGGAAGVAVAVIATVVIGGIVYAVTTREDGTQQVTPIDDTQTTDTTTPIDTSYFDTPFSQPQYLIHATGHGTTSGPVEDDYDFLFPVEPDGEGFFLVPDGSGGTFGYSSDFHVGPFSTPREVCGAAAGRRETVFGAWNSNDSFDCALLG